MNDAERHALHFGPYCTPRFRLGSVVFCEVRGEVTIVDVTNGRIPWPIGKKKRARSLVIFAGLADAVRRESNQAICYWWSVTPQTVTVWRKALDVGATTEGTSKLRRAYAFADAVVQGLRKAMTMSRNPERCAKIAVSKRGKPRPPHVQTILARGRKKLAKLRQKRKETESSAHGVEQRSK